LKKKKIIKTKEKSKLFAVLLKGFILEIFCNISLNL